MKTHPRIEDARIRPASPIDEGETILEAVRQMAEGTDFLCVMDDQGRLAGTVCRSDLRGMVFDRRDAVRTVTNRQAFPVAMDFSAVDVAGALQDDPGIFLIPVVATNDGALVGVVLREDILELAAAGSGAPPSSPRAGAPSPQRASEEVRTRRFGGYGDRNNTEVIQSRRFKRAVGRLSRQESE